MKLSVAIITYNEEKNIVRLLEETEPLADEIIIVDSHSTDATAEIVAKYPKVKFFVKDFEGYGKQKNFALSKCSGEWILFLDSDEIPDEKAKNEIKTITEGAGECDIYKIKFNNILLGKTLHYGEWGNVWRERLYRNGCGSYTDDAVHEGFIAKGKIGQLEGRINHYTYKNIAHHVEKINKYTSAMADKMQKNGKTFSFFKIIISPVYQFCKNYFFKLGLLDGIPGFYTAVNSAYYTFLKYIKLFENQNYRT